MFPNSCDESHKVTGQVARPNDRVDLVLPLKPLYHRRRLAARFAVASVHDTLPFVALLPDFCCLDGEGLNGELSWGLLTRLLLNSL